MYYPGKNKRFEHRFVVVQVDLPAYAAGDIASSVKPKALVDTQEEAARFIHDASHSSDRSETLLMTMLGRMEDKQSADPTQLYAVFRISPMLWPEINPERDVSIQRVVSSKSRAEEEVGRLNRLNGPKGSLYFCRSIPAAV